MRWPGAAGAALGARRQGLRFDTDMTESAALADLFGGRSQLMVYHFMFGPDYKAGCPSCSSIADGFNGVAVHLQNHDVALWAVSRAPLAEAAGLQAAHGLEHSPGRPRRRRRLQLRFQRLVHRASSSAQAASNTTTAQAAASAMDPTRVAGPSSSIAAMCRHRCSRPTRANGRA